MPKRILAISDFHCGHKTGLTPPAYWEPEHTVTGQVQREIWHWYEAKVIKNGPYDACFFLGDMIDGDGKRSGGTELLTTDRLEQCKIAINCIKTIPTHQSTIMLLVRGTPYHVGQEEDFENVIAEHYGMTVNNHGWAESNGVVFDLKHKVGGSSVPWGRHTAVSKEHYWNMLWAEKEYAPKADVLLRGHVHYFNYCGGMNWFGATLPAMQGPGSKFGEQQCLGTVDVGFLVFTVYDDGGFTWEPHLLKFSAGKPEVVKV